MLTRKQKENLRQLSYSQIFLCELNGVPVDSTFRNPISIPNVLELREYVFQEIHDLGFNTINIVNPWKANLIVRIFYKLHYPIDYPQMHNLYGYQCYTRSGCDWITKSGKDTIRFTPSKYIHRFWFNNDEYVNYNCDFIDLYLEIKQAKKDGAQM